MTASKTLYAQKIVTLGGGTGHFALLRGLVDLNEPELITAITGTWDNGGSSGRLRTEMGVLPSGDTRQCLLALMEDENQRVVAQKLFNERFNDQDGPLKGHSIGNLIQSQLQRIFQGQDRGTDATRALFRIRAHVLPVSLTDVELCAKTDHGHVIEGESTIDLRGDSQNFDPEEKISRIYFDTSADPNPKAIDAIRKADKIIFSPGDLFTSVLPHLLVKDIAKAIIHSKAKIYFVLNLMTKKGETDSYKASNFLKALIFYLGSNKRLDFIIANQNHISKEVIKVYDMEGQEPIEIDLKNCQAITSNLKIIQKPLAKYYPKEHLLRHDSAKLAQVILSTN
ncbi:YvcK family protein [Candidatus Daviesbacteria bacterium]|nr:YvcK family protein [Candidatus Daviesbacteria bacterium]